MGERILSFSGRVRPVVCSATSVVVDRRTASTDHLSTYLGDAVGNLVQELGTEDAQRVLPGVTEGAEPKVLGEVDVVVPVGIRAQEFRPPGPVPHARREARTDPVAGVLLVQEQQVLVQGS
jgi:hypothetical protein